VCRGIALLVAGVFTLASANAANDNIGGFSEAVISVSEFEPHLDFYEEEAGWEVVERSSIDPRFGKFWQLDSAGPIDQILLRNPGTDRGYVRLVHFPQPKRRQIRSNDQAWDTGGIFDLNLRVADMASVHASLQAKGWQGTTDPVEFSFGPFRVGEWIVRGPDGVRYALIERIEPPLEGWPHLRKFSRVFNSTQIVRDIEAARAFYVDKLGFDVYLESSRPSPAAGPNVLGLPHNLATEITRHVFILHPQKANDGSVEILQFDGATGVSFADRAVPPNIGALMLRFPVQDMERLLMRFRDREITVVAGPMTLNLPPYGEVRLVAVRAPDGAWLEFYESLK